MAMKKYSVLSRSLELEPHHQMYSSVIPRIPFFGGWGRLTPLQGYSQCILSPTKRVDDTLNIITLQDGRFKILSKYLLPLTMYIVYPGQNFHYCTSDLFVIGIAGFRFLFYFS